MDVGYVIVPNVNKSDLYSPSASDVRQALQNKKTQTHLCCFGISACSLKKKMKSHCHICGSLNNLPRWSAHPRQKCLLHKYLLVKHANAQAFNSQQYSLTSVILQAFYLSASEGSVFFSARG